jgi:hypothetical protein
MQELGRKLDLYYRGKLQRQLNRMIIMFGGRMRNPFEESKMSLGLIPERGEKFSISMGLRACFCIITENISETESLYEFW